MADNMFMASVLNGIANGFVTGMKIRQDRDAQVADQAYKNKLIGIQEQELGMKKQEAAGKLDFRQFAEGSTGMKLEDLMKDQAKYKKTVDEWSWQGKERVSPRDNLQSKAEGIRALGVQLAIAKEANSMAQKENDNFKTMDNIYGLLDKAKRGNQQAIAALRTQLPRFYGEKGAMSDADVNRNLESPELFVRFQNAFSLASEGKLTKEVLNNLYETVGVMKNNSQKIYEQKKQAFLDRGEEASLELGRSPDRKKLEKMYGFKAYERVADNAPAGFSKDVVDYARRHGIDPETANRIKMQRMGTAMNKNTKGGI